jgi:hypothetical protein
LTLCQCGCGQPAPLAKKTDASNGRVLGQPQRFINGHGRRRPLWDRFREKVEFRMGDCWTWLASTGSHGYGQIGSGVGKEMRLAHVVSYEFFVGPIPERMDLHHLCENPACVHPLHLEPTTRKDHIQRHRGDSVG